jgi:hypothetical protein
MANLNDFKLVNQKSNKYFNLLENELSFNSENFSDKDKERYGFYLFVLESISGKKDILDLVNLITDTEFNSNINGLKINDLGVDAVFIDKEKSTINLFNFKFRESFKWNKGQDTTEATISTKFINAISENNIDFLDNKLKEYAEEILKCFNSSTEWNFKLYIVSNDTKEFTNDSTDIKLLEEHYSLEVIPFGLPKIMETISLRPAPINASLVVDTNAVMSYAENDLSSSISYILRLVNSEIIRITCDNNEIRSQHNIEDEKILYGQKPSFSVLFDNVRGFKQKSTYNQNILKSLKEEPEKFFMYNNGITIIADAINAKKINSNKRLKLDLKNIQVLNGGQTLRTIHSFNSLDENNITDYLSKSETLVRIFTTQDEYINKIAEYTNSQNPISNVDLKSLRNEQIQLEQYLDDHNIIYARKTGDTGLVNDKKYLHKISMEKFGQILFSIKGNPHKATSQKKQIFDKNYQDIFGKSLDIGKAPEQVKNYFIIMNEYKQLNLISSDNKVFYILYLLENIPSKTIENLILSLEKFLSIFKTEKELADTRKLLQLTFKEKLDEYLNIHSE